jgi:DNA-binding beta-propeller fold protein YncE
MIAGGSGAFDWMLVDGRSDRVFATHKGTRSVAIVDLKTDMALPSVTVGTAQGVAVDRRDNKVFLGDEDEHKVVVLDYTTLKKTGEIVVTGPVDDVLFCSKNGMVYADCDNGEEVWVIDAKSEKVVATVTTRCR